MKHKTTQRTTHLRMAQPFGEADMPGILVGIHRPATLEGTKRFQKRHVAAAR